MSFEIQNNILKKYTDDCNESVSVIPDGIKEISRFCFSGVCNIRKIVLPDTLRKINKLAFDGCKNLEEINIPESVNIIEDHAFRNCEALEYIFIPESVLFIGDNIFSGCKNLKQIEISENNPNYIVKNNVLFSRDMSNLLSYTVTKPERCFRIPDSVSRIGGEAFSGSSLEKIVMPENLKIIEHLAFSGCRSLRDINIPENIVNLSSMTFLQCTSLRNIDIPLSAISISNFCFDGCTALESVKMPFNIKIGETSFMHCSSIKCLTLFDDKYTLSIHTQKNIRYCDMKKILSFFQNGFSEEIFSSIKRFDCKLPIALFVLHQFEIDFCYKYVKKNIRKAVRYLIDEDNAEILDKILFLKLVSTKYIDEMIEYAEKSERLHMRDIMEAYKIMNKLYRNS